MNIAQTGTQATSVQADKSFDLNGRTISESVAMSETNFMAEAYSSQFRAGIVKTESGYELTAGDSQMGKSAMLKTDDAGTITLTINGEVVGTVTVNGLEPNP